MKKILQRIGLLAMAGMLLWGWQGMNAKAADDIFTFKCDGPHIDKTKLKVVQEGNNYHFDIYPEDGYAFTQKPAASLDDDTAGATVGTFIVDKASDNTFYSCSIGNVSLDSTRKYSIRIYVYDIIEITKIRITPTEPVIGQTLPSIWGINTTGVRENPLVWMSDSQNVTGSVAKPNKTYFAYITLSTEPQYKFSDNVAIAPNSVRKDPNSEGSITFVYEFTTGDAQPSNPGNTNSEVTWEKWNAWTINTDKLQNGRIAKGYGLSGSAEESHKTHLFLYVEPDDGYYFTEEPKVSWNDTLLVPMPKDSSTLYGYKYQLDDNGSGTIVVEGTAAKKETNESENNGSETSAPASNDDSSEEPYKIINGAKGTWNGSTTEGLTIRGDGDFAKFAGVRVDGNWIPSAHYEAKSGSTIVTLKPSYLASLSEGEHTVDIMWIDDSASTTFTVAANTAAAQAELDSVPKTGEGVMGWMPEISLLVAAGLTIMGALRLKKAK